MEARVWVWWGGEIKLEVVNRSSKTKKQKREKCIHKYTYICKRTWVATYLCQIEVERMEKHHRMPQTPPKPPKHQTCTRTHLCTHQYAGIYSGEWGLTIDWTSIKRGKRDLEWERERERKRDLESREREMDANEHHYLVLPRLNLGHAMWFARLGPMCLELCAWADLD